MTALGILTGGTWDEWGLWDPGGAPASGKPKEVLAPLPPPMMEGAAGSIRSPHSETPAVYELLTPAVGTHSSASHAHLVI